MRYQILPGSSYLFDTLEHFARAGLGTRPHTSARASFPAVNVGSSATSVDVYLFASGVDPAKFELDIDDNLLSIKGTRPEAPASEGSDSTVRTRELFSGEFQRLIALPEDVDSDSAKASYKDGVLHVSIQRRAASQPKRISVA